MLRVRLPFRFSGALAGASFLAAMVALAKPAHAQLSAGEPKDKFSFEYWMMSLGGPTDVAFLPDGRAVVTLKDGHLVIRKANGDVSGADGPAAFKVDSDSEKGLLGVVADPDFATNKTLYFYASDGPTAADKHRVRKATLSDDNKLTIADPPLVGGGTTFPGLQGPANHDGGGMQIHNGYLFIGVGDTGANATPPVNKYGTCLNHANGKILRVKLSDGSVPTDNPLVGLTSVTSCDSVTGAFGTKAPDTRIYAWGFRNPFRFWVDPKTGKLWVGDVGETTQEEVTLADKGTHSGWPFVEGTMVYPHQEWTPKTCMDVSPATPCTGPVHSYPHKSGDQCVIGGQIPEGCGWEGSLANRYFFADHDSGRVWWAKVNDTRLGFATPPEEFARVGKGPVAFRQGLDGALYMVSHEEGVVYRIAPKTKPANCPVVEAPPGKDAGPSGGSDSGVPGVAGAGGKGGVAGATPPPPGTGGALGGTAGRGGTTGAAGRGANDGGAAGAAGGSDSGCGCRLSGQSGRQLGGGALVAGLFGLAVFTRRRSARKRGDARLHKE